MGASVHKPYTPQSRALWRSDQKRTCWEFAKPHTAIALHKNMEDGSLLRWDVAQTHHPKNPSPIMKHGAGSILLWGCFSSVQTRKLVKITGQSFRKTCFPAWEWRLGRRFAFQQCSVPDRTAKATLKCFKWKHFSIFVVYTVYFCPNIFMCTHHYSHKINYN